MCLLFVKWQFRDEQTYYRLRHANPPESLEVEMDDLESKAGEFGIYDLSGFYSSNVFRDKRWVLRFVAGTVSMGHFLG